MENVKKCATCHKEFKKGKNISKKSWLSVRYCSRSCINIGRSSWNKGIPRTEKEKLHLSKVLLGRCCNTGRTHIKKGQRLSPSTEFKKGNIPWTKGKKLLYNAGEKK